ncbi:hypothetical protein HY251_11575 [bacterium]|nr:hypothetical protein [bacterium]
MGASPDPRRVYVRLPNWVGDVVLATPFLSALRRAFPRAEIVAHGEKRLFEILEGAGHYDRTIPIERPPSPVWPLLEGRRVRRLAGPCDLAIVLPNSFSAALVARALGAPRRIGYRLDARRLLLTDSLPVKKEGRLRPIPMIDYYLGLLAPLGVDTTGEKKRPSLPVSEASRERVRALLARQGVREGDRVWALNAGGVWETKRWIPEYLGQLVDMIVARGSPRAQDRLRGGGLLAVPPPRVPHRLPLHEAPPPREGRSHVRRPPRVPRRDGSGSEDVSQDERKREILEQATKDKELLAQVPPIVALAFGVLPIARNGSVLTVACFARANHDALRLLRDVLELEIVATPFDDRQLMSALSDAYHADEDGSVNFPTFREPTFLVKPGTAALLREQKIERTGEAGCTLPATLVALASLTYRGCLWNLDAQKGGSALPDPKRTKYELKDDDLAFTLSGSEPVAWSQEGAVAGTTVLLLNEFRFSDHRSHGPQALHAEHNVSGKALAATSFPHVIHPTEIQLLRLESDGSLVFHAYDHEERIVRISSREPQRPRSFKCSYFFLSYGNCLRRAIEIVVHELYVLERTRLAVKPGKAPWGPLELERWFAGAALS